MSQQRTRNRGAGLVLILLGLFFLVQQLRPGLMSTYFSWPLLIVGVGGIFLLAALLTREGAFAIPGTIVSGVGTLLLWQNYTGEWESWAYAWTLIPGFVGIGIILAHLLGERKSGSLAGGLALVTISASAFLLFATVANAGWYLLRFWPVGLILVGALMLGRAILRPTA
jgi:hypothetical protein